MWSCEWNQCVARIDHVFWAEPFRCGRQSSLEINLSFTFWQRWVPLFPFNYKFGEIKCSLPLDKMKSVNSELLFSFFLGWSGSCCPQPTTSTYWGGSWAIRGTSGNCHHEISRGYTCCGRVRAVSQITFNLLNVKLPNNREEFLTTAFTRT